MEREMQCPGREDVHVSKMSVDKVRERGLEIEQNKAPPLPAEAVHRVKLISERVREVEESVGEKTTPLPDVRVMEVKVRELNVNEGDVLVVSGSKRRGQFVKTNLENVAFVQINSPCLTSRREDE